MTIKLIDILSEEVKSLIVENGLSGLKMNSPVGPPAPISSTFGKRDLDGDGVEEQHDGVDLAVVSGTDIRCPMDGEVVEADLNFNSTCGGLIEIKHMGGIFNTVYCHVSDVIVSKGDKVNQGQVIGKSGGGPSDPGKGNSMGPHLHLGLKTSGIFIDPERFFNFDEGVKEKTRTPINRDPYRRDMPSNYTEIDYDYDDIVNNNRTLVQGQKGVIITNIKEKLDSLGYNVGNDEQLENDEFDTPLVKAIQKFQKFNDLTPTGKADSETIKLIWELSER